MNREVGFGHKVLKSWKSEYSLGTRADRGIDDLSIIPTRELTPIKRKKFLRPTPKIEVDHAEIEHSLSIIMIVGEQMKNHIGLAATATKALSDNKINIQMISQRICKKFLSCS